ncbi:pre-mRNA-splicing factor CWC21-like [Papio anubis]|uniref:pre-mRNA-splicing factor CWC21-like n=1 Tax=Papio anubis TaxID=9555 RepID=UPI0012ADC890|nr:pre-mRNA-splicing factor CWC21-like [Papio anubis]
MERRRRPHASPPRPPPRVTLADPNSHRLSFSARSSRRRRCRRSGEESELEPPRPRQGWGKRADLARARAKRAGRSRARARTNGARSRGPRALQPSGS